jgi:SulP family sulfate permease
MLVITFLATFTSGIEFDIGVGFLLSLAKIIYFTSMPHVAEFGNIPSTFVYRNTSRYDDVFTIDDILIIRFDRQLYF